MLILIYLRSHQKLGSRIGGSHNLNLCLAASCKTPIINNIETYKAITISLNTSPKREGLLEHIVQTRCGKWNIEKRNVLIGMCRTRWSERDVSYGHFYLVLPFIAEALEVINSTHPQLDTFAHRWVEFWFERRSDIILKSLVWVEVYYRDRFPLPLIAEITQTLQGRTTDVAAAYTQVHLGYGAYEGIHRRGASANIQVLGAFGSQALYRTVYSKNCGEAKILS